MPGGAVTTSQIPGLTRFVVQSVSWRRFFDRFWSILDPFRPGIGPFSPLFGGLWGDFGRLCHAKSGRRLVANRAGRDKPC
jgi:hypothetical protein